MIKEFENELSNNLPSTIQNVSKIDYQSEKKFNGRKIFGNVSHYLELKDSVDKFISKHSVFVENNINTYDPSMSHSSLASDVHFGNEVLLSVLLNSNFRLNKLMYRLAVDLKKEKQNRQLKRFINILRNKQDYEVDESKQNNKEKTVKYSPSNRLTSELLSNSNEKIPKLSTVPSSATINKYSSKINHHSTKPVSKAKKQSTKSVSLNKPFNKRVQEIYSDLPEDYLYPNNIKSKLDITRSESEGRDPERKNTVNEAKSLEDIGNLIDKQIDSINFLIEGFKEITNKENGEILCIKNTAEVDCNISKQVKTDNQNDSSLLSIDKQEITQRICENKNLDTNFECEIQNNYHKNIVIDHSKILKDIENKIDKLINTVQLLIIEIKEQKLKENEYNFYIPHLKKGVDCNAIQNKQEHTVSEVDSFCNDKFGMITQTSSYLLEMVKILQNRNIKYKNEIKTNMQANCYYGTTLRVYLMEKATEVTKSFIGTELNISEVNMIGANSMNLGGNVLCNTPENSNKESLSILALLKICTQFVKQFLALVPLLNYSYCGQGKFSFLKGDKETNYVCNICEEVFYKASMLNAHIKTHDSGFASDCGVCNHALERHKLSNVEHFKCQFCGKRFMRAYCCELHQQSCAKSLGLRQDVSSNLLLLR